MTTVNELTDIVKELEQRLREATELIGEQRKSALATAAPTVVVHTNKERKLMKYSEKDDIDDWCDSIKGHSAMKTLSTELDRVSFIMDYLTENPKRTLKVQIDKKKATTKEVFEILKDAYSNKKSLFQLQTDFFKTDQGDCTIQEYSHTIMKQLLILQKKDPVTYRDADMVMKDRFAEGLQSTSLKHEMKRINREQIELKFHELLHLAESWVKDNEISNTNSESS